MASVELDRIVLQLVDKATAGHRQERREKHEPGDGPSFRDQGNRQASERMTDQDDVVGRVADGFGHDLGVARAARRQVLAGKVDRQDVVPAVA